MIASWILCLVILALAVVALMRFSRVTTFTSKLVTGAAAMILGVLGLVLAAALVF